MVDLPKYDVGVSCIMEISIIGLLGTKKRGRKNCGGNVQIRYRKIIGGVDVANNDNKVVKQAMG